MAKKQVTLEHIGTLIKRHRARVKRSMNAIDRLERQVSRIMLKAAKAARASVPAHPTVDSETTLGTVPPAPRVITDLREITAAPKPAPASSFIPQSRRGPQPTGDEIPAFLRRQDNTSPVADQIRQEQAETKKAKARGRIEKMKAKQRGDLKRMPLTGKAALAAIRG